MRVCIEKATGKLIEMQSFPTPGTLLKNAAAAGLKPADLAEKEVTPEEWAILKEKWIDSPAREKAEARLLIKQEAQAVIQQRLGLDNEEWKLLQLALAES